MNVRALFIATSLLLGVACGGERGRTSPMEDPRDGLVYPTVRIGSQIWFASNLRFDSGAGSRCFADEPDNCERYGRLYTWPTALAACPPGWHLPSETEWQTLERFLGLDESLLEETRYRGSDEGDRLRPGGDSGFDALQGGYMRPDGTSRRQGERAAFWTATRAEGRESAWHRDVSGDARIYRSPVDFGYYLSVRCLRD